LLAASSARRAARETIPITAMAVISPATITGYARVYLTRLAGQTERTVVLHEPPGETIQQQGSTDAADRHRSQSPDKAE
jgi:hypothetical protein